MLKEQHKTKLRICPAYVLSILFLLFIFYIGCAALPQFLIQTGQMLYWREGARSFIKKTNEQYSGMLEAESEYPLFHNKGTYINFNGLMAKMLRQPMVNDRVMLKNGHLSHVVSNNTSPEDIRLTAANIIRFSNLQTASGGNFLFVMVPGQISKYEDLLPDGYTDTTNATADAFLSLLEQAGVSYLDLREEMQKDNLSVTEAFYTTDHHWTPQAGFWAYGKILDKLAQMGAIAPVDHFYTDPANYTFETHEDTFLGSSGRRTGIYYAGLDDSILIRPNFQTDIAVQIPELNRDLRGRFEEVAYNVDAIPDYNDPNFYQENSYGLYGWGDTEITHWRNEQALEEGKFLLIGESFGNVPFSLMSIYMSSCDEMDMRYYDGEFAAYYESYSPDTVVVLVNPDMTISEFTSYPYLG